MCSAAVGDLEGRARIRNAALALLGAAGHDGVTVRTIAKAAGVSPALVMFHFGSKQGLIDAVDAHVAETLERIVREAARQTDIDLVRAIFGSVADDPDVLAYLARSLVDAGGVGDQLFDRLHVLSMSALRGMAEAGLARRVDDVEGAAAWLLAAELGALVLRGHLARVLGVDPYGPDGIDRLASIELDLLSRPLLTFSDGDASRGAAPLTTPAHEGGPQA